MRISNRVTPLGIRFRSNLAGALIVKSHIKAHIKVLT